MDPLSMTTARKNSSHEHYVNNKQFSQSVAEFVREIKKAGFDKKKHRNLEEAEKQGLSMPRIPPYIGQCFLRIAEGLSHKPNFSRYSYREEMVGDGIENCVKAVVGYDDAAATRSGSPNAFAYFTQICYYAFLRRIAKEKKQQDIKHRYIEHCGVNDLMENHEFATEMEGQESVFINQMKKRMIRDQDQETGPLEKFT